MFGNSKTEFYSNMFQIKKQKSELCDYCNALDASVDFYVQTPNYYRNKSSGHHFMCSINCKTCFLNEKTCKKCGYGNNLKMTDNGYSLCTDYPNEHSCYDTEAKFKRYFDGTSDCSFCEKGHENCKMITFDENTTLNVCKDCWSIYRKIVLWEEEYSDKVQCVFCKSVDCGFISRFGWCDNLRIHLCKKCLRNYTLLTSEKRVFGFSKVLA